jgi:hypothetical protein
MIVSYYGKTFVVASQRKKGQDRLKQQKNLSGNISTKCCSMANIALLGKQLQLRLVAVVAYAEQMKGATTKVHNHQAPTKVELLLLQNLGHHRERRNPGVFWFATSIQFGNVSIIPSGERAKRPRPAVETALSTTAGKKRQKVENKEISGMVQIAKQISDQLTAPTNVNQTFWIASRLNEMSAEEAKNMRKAINNIIDS